MSGFDWVWDVVGLAFLVEIGFSLKDRFVGWVHPDEDDE